MISRTRTPILVLVPGFAADELDEDCLPPIQTYVEALSRRRSPGAVQVIAFQYPFARRSYEWRGVRVHAMGGCNRTRAKPLVWARALRVGGRFAGGRSVGGRFVGERRGGVVHSFWMGECALVGAALARRHGWKHVVSIGGQEALRDSIYSRLLRRSALTLTAGSVLAADAARRNLEREVDAVIPLGLGPEIGRSSGRRGAVHPEERLTDAARPIDVLAVGSLIALKRVGDVVSVAERLKERLPELTVHIVGDGPERPRLEDQIAAAELQRHVALRGRLPRGEVLRLMRQSKVLLHPSEYESQGYVFLEALASGMYVVCREVGFQPQSSNITYASGVQEMAAAVLRRLEGAHDARPVPVPTAEQTVDAFEELYEG